MVFTKPEEEGWRSQGRASNSEFKANLGNSVRLCCKMIKTEAGGVACLLPTLVCSPCLSFFLFVTVSAAWWNTDDPVGLSSYSCSEFMSYNSPAVFRSQHFTTLLSIL